MNGIYICTTIVVLAMGAFGLFLGYSLKKDRNKQ